MKRFFVVATSVLAVAFCLWLVMGPGFREYTLPKQRAGLQTNRVALAVSGKRSNTLLPTIMSRRNMSLDERLRFLEDCGEVPEDADSTDWQLAQKTTWWGRPLNPTVFWKGRVIWPDRSAREAARRRGRANPPPPYEDASLPRYPDDEGVRWETYEVEGPNLHFAGSSKEAAFWDRFTKTHPHPPDELAHEQLVVAQAVLGNRFRLHSTGDLNQTVSPRSNQSEAIAKHRAEVLGTPPEPLGDDALRWAYILKKRQEYKTQVEPLSEGNPSFVSNWLANLFVTPSVVTGRLSQPPLTQANAWKIAYLQRLRREGIDDSYISAYLQAWNLTREEVFQQ